MENTKLNEKEIKQKTPQPFNTGWCHQPVLKGSLPPELARATWLPFSTGSCGTGTKGGGTFSPHTLVPVTEPALKVLTNRCYSPVLH
jgi:hypothetical protein